MNLVENIRDAKRFSKSLAKYSYPNCSYAEDYDIAFLKERHYNIRGWWCIVSYAFNELSEYSTETLSIRGMYHSVLPFDLVLYLVKAYLGNDKMLFYESSQFEMGGAISQNYRKNYVWIKTTDRNGGFGVPGYGNNVQLDSFEGFEFYRAPSQISNGFSF